MSLMNFNLEGGSEFGDNCSTLRSLRIHLLWWCFISRKKMNAPNWSWSSSEVLVTVDDVDVDDDDVYYYNCLRLKLEGDFVHFFSSFAQNFLVDITSPERVVWQWPQAPRSGSFWPPAWFTRWRQPAATGETSHFGVMQSSWPRTTSAAGDVSCISTDPADTCVLLVVIISCSQNSKNWKTEFTAGCGSDECFNRVSRSSFSIHHDDQIIQGADTGARPDKIVLPILWCMHPWPISMPCA